MTDAATIESKAEEEQKAAATDGGGAAFVALWLKALDLADNEEKDWRKKAEEVYDVYRGKKTASESRTFNILYSNVETICPALYNSTPVPDIRRRYADDDKVGKLVADILERALSYSIDTYDFDATMQWVVRDGELPGRGLLRVRYVPHFAHDGLVAYEEVRCEYVPWRFFRRGPGRTWNDIPWMAFGDFLTRDDLRQLCGDAKDKNGNPVSEQVPLTYTAEKRDGKRKSGEREQGIFSTALVWQIWDRDRRKVISIAPGYPDAPLAAVDDPLELEQFFPVPRPYQPVVTTDSLVPVPPYELYEDHVVELNEVTRRITKVVKQMRLRGGYASDQSGDIKSISEADDGELVPMQGLSHLATEGGIDKAIAWWPIERLTAVLKVLIEHRENIKQVIYEVSGLSDILRGSTDPNETLGAQQIKAQWGSVRFQARQGDVARIARDVFRLKAEIIANKFSWETLSQMTGVNAPTAEQKAQAQAMIQMAQQRGQQVPAELQSILDNPSREEIEEVLRHDITRSYRIDIESDSTIRGDLTRNQQTMTAFLQGTAQFAQAMGPIVMQMPNALPAVVQVYRAFARQFKLGRQADSALEKLEEGAQASLQQTNEKKSDPKADAEKVKAEADTKRATLQMERDQRKHDMDMQRMEREDQSKMMDMAARDQEMQMAGMARQFMSATNPMRQPAQSESLALSDA